METERSNGSRLAPEHRHSANDALPDEAIAAGLQNSAPAELAPDGSAEPRWLDMAAEPPAAFATLTVLGILAFFVNLGGYPLYTKGEPREAVTILDMVNGGGLILPMRAGVEVPSKPLMMHWMSALVSLAAGAVNEWTVRIPTAALAMLGVILCYFYVRKLFDSRSALIAALILGTSAQYLQAGSGARVDMTLSFFMEVGFFEFIMVAEGLSDRVTLMYVALACAVLSKGPIGAALPALVAAIWIAVERRWSLLRDLKLLRGVAIVGILAGGWYVAAAIIGGSPFIHKQIVSENLGRLLHEPEFIGGHRHPFYYVEAALLAGLMPWTLLIPAAVMQSIRRPPRMSPRLTYILVWFFAVLIFYTLPASKRGVYLLALYPAAAALIAIFLDDAIREPAAVRRFVHLLSRLGGFALIAAGLAAMIGLAMLALRPQALGSILAAFDITAPGFVGNLQTEAGQYALVSIALPFVVASIGLVLVAARPHVATVVGAATASAVAITLAANLFVVPAIANTLTLRQFALIAMNEIGHGSVSYLMALDYDVAFYSRRTIPIIETTEAPGPDFLICWKRVYDDLPIDQRSQFEVVLTSNPTELSGGGEMLLLHRKPGASSANI